MWSPVEPRFDELQTSADVDESFPVSELQQLMRQFAQFTTIESSSDVAITGEDYRLIGHLSVFDPRRFSTRRKVRLPCIIVLTLLVPHFSDCGKMSPPKRPAPCWSNPHSGAQS